MTSAAASTSSTFGSYIAFAAKALQKSRKSLDSHALIQLAYGNDTAHIGGSVMLMGILDSVLDKISKEVVLEQLKHYGTSDNSVIDSIEMNQRESSSEKAARNEHAALNKTTPQDRLEKIDQIISHVIKWEEERNRIESFDAKAARECLHHNQLPKSVTTKDFVVYREHKQRLQARTALQQELRRIKDDTSILRKEREEKEENVRKQVGEITKAGRELEVSANICAMISI